MQKSIQWILTYLASKGPDHRHYISETARYIRNIIAFHTFKLMHIAHCSPVIHVYNLQH